MIWKNYSNQHGEPASEQKPVRVEDFFGPNPFVRPWMEKFLPKNRRLQDGTIVVVGSALGALIIFAMSSLLGTVGMYVGGALGLMIAFVVQSNGRSRYLAAGMKYQREKERRNAENR